MRTIRLLGFPAVCVLLLGCFTLQRSIGDAPEAGKQVAFDVNDAGRIALGGSMGPEIAQIEGRLVETGGGEYVIAVSAIRLLRGGEQVWSGERVRIKSEHVGSTFERRFSRGRTIALGAVTIGGVTAFLLGRDLIGAGSGGRPGMPTDTGDAFRVRP